MMDKDKMITAYQRAINKIDDYFEYRAESAADRSKVHDILSDLTEELKTCQSSTQS